MLTTLFAPLFVLLDSCSACLVFSTNPLGKLVNTLFQSGFSAAMSLSERNVMIRKGAYHFDLISSESTISIGHGHGWLPSLAKYFLIKVFVARQIPMEGGNIIYDTIGQKQRTPVFRNMQIFSSKDNGYNCNTQYSIAF